MSALYLHTLVVDGQEYTLLARGESQWVFRDDVVSFSYRITPAGEREIVRCTLVTLDKRGVPVVRGDRRTKPTARTALFRVPADHGRQPD